MAVKNPPALLILICMISSLSCFAQNKDDDDGSTPEVTQRALDKASYRNDDDGSMFRAATYVITQKALDEAPYRYAKFLDDALRKLEQQDFPMSSNGDHCGFRYSIGPTTEKSRLRLFKDTIKVSQLLVLWHDAF